MGLQLRRVDNWTDQFTNPASPQQAVGGNHIPLMGQVQQTGGAVQPASAPHPAFNGPFAVNSRPANFWDTVGNFGANLGNSLFSTVALPADVIAHNTNQLQHDWNASIPGGVVNNASHVLSTLGNMGLSGVHGLIGDHNAENQDIANAKREFDQTVLAAPFRLATTGGATWAGNDLLKNGYNPGNVLNAMNSVTNNAGINSNDPEATRKLIESGVTSALLPLSADVPGTLATVRKGMENAAREVKNTDFMSETGSVKLPGNDPNKKVIQAQAESKPNGNFNADQYVQDMTKAREQAANPPVSFKDRAIAAKDKFKVGFVDTMAPIEDRMAAAKKAGADIAPENDIRYAIDRAMRADTIAGQYVKDGGLASIIQNVPDNNKFEQYLIAKHAVELDGGVKTGRNAANDKKLVSTLKTEYEPYAQSLYKYSHDLLDRSAGYGLISKDTAAALKTRYPNYVPFNRVFADGELNGPPQGVGKGKASLSSQNVVQNIKGSERQVESPLHSVLMRTQDVIEQGERNNAAHILAGYKELPGNPFNLRELGKDEQIGHKPVISYLDNGVKRSFETDPAIAQAAKSLNAEQLGLIGKILSYPTRLLRLGATGINPGFALANVTKDTMSAFINSSHPLRSSVANPEVFVQALVASLNHGSAAYGELVREGAGGTSFDIARDAPKPNVNSVRAQKNVGTKVLYTVTHPGELLRAVENTIGRSEEFGRAIQYFGNKQASLKEGRTASQARLEGAYAARNNTVNFARAGQYGRVLNSVLPYLNAGIQGSRTLLRNLKDRPLQTATKIAVVAFTPVAVTTAWNLSDPERKKAYDNISDYEKQGNIIIVPQHPTQDPKTGRWNVIKIPVSQEIANLNSIVRNDIEAMAGDKKFDFGELAANLTGTATSLNVQSPRQLANQTIPQAFKPVVEGLTNQNLFTGNQIVPDALQNLPANKQVSKTTSGTAKVLGGLTGVSPMVIDNTIRTATGGLGDNIVNAADTGLAAVGAIKPGDIRGKDIFTAIASRFDSAAGQTDGSVFFNTIQQNSKDLHLAGRDLDYLNALMSKSVDADGNPIPQDDKSALDRNRILADNPKVAAVLAKTAQDLANKQGKPLDPLFNLSANQQQAYYHLEATPYKSEDYQNITNRNQSWLPQLQKERSAFFANNPPPLGTTPPDKVKFPHFDVQTESDLNSLNNMDAKTKAEFITNHPNVKAAFDQLEKYTNNRRAATDYAAFKNAPQAAPQLQQFMNQYSSADKSSKTGLRNANPKMYQNMIAFYDSVNLSTINKEGAVNRLQGEPDQTSKQNKAISGLAKDIYQNPDGTYSIHPAGWMDGLSNGSGGGGSSKKKKRPIYAANYMVSSEAGHNASVKGPRIKKLKVRLTNPQGKRTKVSFKTKKV